MPTHKPHSPPALTCIVSHPTQRRLLLRPPPRKTQRRRRCGYGALWGYQLDVPRPLIIRLDNGVHFSCGGLTAGQQRQLLNDDVLGRRVAFFYDHLDADGQPVNPRFKTLVMKPITGKQNPEEC